MNINALIISTLTPLGIPVSFQTYTGTETTYITFFKYLEDVESYANNKETSLVYYIQVDVWSKGNYSVLVESVLEALKQAGFTRNYVTETYENDIKLFHKIIRVQKFKEVL